MCGWLCGETDLGGGGHIDKLDGRVVLVGRTQHHAVALEPPQAARLEVGQHQDLAAYPSQATHPPQRSESENGPQPIHRLWPLSSGGCDALRWPLPALISSRVLTCEVGFFCVEVPKPRGDLPRLGLPQVDLLTPQLIRVRVLPRLHPTATSTSSVRSGKGQACWRWHGPELVSMWWSDWKARTLLMTPTRMSSALGLISPSSPPEAWRVGGTSQTTIPSPNARPDPSRRGSCANHTATPSRVGPVCQPGRIACTYLRRPWPLQAWPWPCRPRPSSPSSRPSPCRPHRLQRGDHTHTLRVKNSPLMPNTKAHRSTHLSSPSRPEGWDTKARPLDEIGKLAH